MDTLWIILGCLIGLLMLLLLMLVFGKAKIRIAASASQLKVLLSICGIRIWILPTKKGIFKRGRDSKILRKIQAENQETKLRKLNGEPVPGFLDNLKLVFNLLRIAQAKTQNHLSIRVRKFRIEVASDDAAQTAILYGSVVGLCAWFWEWVQGSLAIVDRTRGAMQVYPNYLKTQSSAEIDVVLKMRTLKAFFVTFGMIEHYKGEKALAEEAARQRQANI